jgi:hypothetical protein
MDYIKHEKHAKEYICEKCDFKCSKSSNFAIHLSTAKHIMITSDYKMHAKKVYNCICGNEYNHRQNLYRHKKTCSEIADVNYKNKIIEELMKQNNELKELIIEQKKRNKN